MTTQLSQLVDRINSQLQRLHVDFESNPYSGIQAELESDRLRIYDDYIDSLFESSSAETFLDKLKKFNPEDYPDLEDRYNQIWVMSTDAGGY